MLVVVVRRQDHRSIGNDLRQDAIPFLIVHLLQDFLGQALRSGLIDISLCIGLDPFDLSFRIGLNDLGLSFGLCPQFVLLGNLFCLDRIGEGVSEIDVLNGC